MCARLRELVRPCRAGVFPRPCGLIRARRRGSPRSRRCAGGNVLIAQADGGLARSAPLGIYPSGVVRLYLSADDGSLMSLRSLLR